MPGPAALLDIDGTLIDNVYLHALAWQRAFTDCGIELPAWRVHRSIGLGGDRLVSGLAGEGAEREAGDRLRRRHSAHFDELADEGRVLPGALSLIELLVERDQPVVLASSSKQEDVDRWVELMGVGDKLTGVTTSADVDTTKPDPDLVDAALDKVDGRESVFVGDTPYDCRAAERAGVPCIGVLTGGFSEPELRESGAIEIWESLEDLVDGFDGSALAG